jgi:hypothetical protein
MSELTSRPFQPNPEICCEACVFGRGQHSPACRLTVEVIDISGERHTFASFGDEEVNRLQAQAMARLRRHLRVGPDRPGGR